MGIRITPYEAQRYCVELDSTYEVQGPQDKLIPENIQCVLSCAENFYKTRNTNLVANSDPILDHPEHEAYETVRHLAKLTDKLHQKALQELDAAYAKTGLKMVEA